VRRQQVDVNNCLAVDAPPPISTRHPFATRAPPLANSSQPTCRMRNRAAFMLRSGNLKATKMH